MGAAGFYFCDMLWRNLGVYSHCLLIITDIFFLIDIYKVVTRFLDACSHFISVSLLDMITVY